MDAAGLPCTADVDLTVQSVVPAGEERWHVGAALHPRTEADGLLLEQYCRIVVPHRRLRSGPVPAEAPAEPVYLDQRAA
jgi:hypothetical protein